VRSLNNSNLACSLLEIESSCESKAFRVLLLGLVRSDFLMEIERSDGILEVSNCGISDSFFEILSGLLMLKLNLWFSLFALMTKFNLPESVRFGKSN
jgi:hypothetical protein